MTRNAHPADGPRSPPRPLGSDFRRLWSASAVSNLGDGVRLAALPLLAASITQDPKQVAGVATAIYLPWLLFALPAGAIADRVDRRRLIVMTQATLAGVVAALAIVVLSGSVTMPVLYGVGFLLGLGEVIFEAASQSLIPTVVLEDELEKANARLYGTEVLTNDFAGPPVGGVLFTLSPGLPFWLDASSFAIGAAVMRNFKSDSSDSQVPGNAMQGLAASVASGLSWLWSHTRLRLLAVAVGLFNLVFAGTSSIFVLFALETLDVGEIGYAVLLSSISVGGVVGAILASRIARWLGRARTISLSFVAMGIALTAVGVAPNAYAVGFFHVSLGFSIIVWSVVVAAFRQAEVPNHLLARVTNAFRLLARGPKPLGAILGGIVADSFGLRAPFLIGGTLFVALLLFVLPTINRQP